MPRAGEGVGKGGEREKRERGEKVCDMKQMAWNFSKKALEDVLKPVSHPWALFPRSFLHTSPHADNQALYKQIEQLSNYAHYSIAGP